MRYILNMHIIINDSEKTEKLMVSIKKIKTKSFDTNTFNLKRFWFFVFTMRRLFRVKPSMRRCIKTLNYASGT